MLRIAVLAVVFTAIRNIYDHSEIQTLNGGCTLWVDYGKLHIHIGQSNWIDGKEFRVLYWPVQKWSPWIAGHRRTGPTLEGM